MTKYLEANPYNSNTVRSESNLIWDANWSRVTLILLDTRAFLHIYTT